MRMHHHDMYSCVYLFLRLKRASNAVHHTVEHVLLRIIRADVAEGIDMISYCTTYAEIFCMKLFPLWDGTWHYSGYLALEKCPNRERCNAGALLLEQERKNCPISEAPRSKKGNWREKKSGRK